MKFEMFKTVSVVHQIRCDRYGEEAEFSEFGLDQMTSIGFDTGYGSIFGDGNRVDMDLCETCVRDTLGSWLQVKTPADIPYANKLLAFKPETHGGEFPRGDDL